MRAAGKSRRDPWFQVRRATRCAFGCDIVWRGFPAPRPWAWFGRFGGRCGRVVLCESCAKTRYGLTRTALPDPLTLPRDGKAAAAGNDN